MAVVFALIADQVRACSLNFTGVIFGRYDYFNNAALHSTGNIHVNCPNGVGYNITLSAGNGTYEQRILSSGAYSLNYNLYTAADRVFVWGDASSGSASVSGSGIGAPVNHVVYARTPPNQNVPAGGYSDTISIMINF